jgi:hypothetical protein
VNKRTEEKKPLKKSPLQHPLRASSAVIYGTFLFLIVTIPQSLENWLIDLNVDRQNAVLGFLVEAIKTASTSTKSGSLYMKGRRLFLDLTGKEED